MHVRLLPLLLTTAACLSACGGAADDTGASEEELVATEISGDYEALDTTALFSQLTLSTIKATPRSGGNGFPATYSARRYSGVRKGLSDRGEVHVYGSGADRYMQLWSDGRVFEEGSTKACPESAACISPVIRIKVSAEDRCTLKLEEAFQHASYGAYRSRSCGTSGGIAGLPVGKISIDTPVSLDLVDKDGHAAKSDLVLGLSGANPGAVRAAVAFPGGTELSTAAVDASGRFSLQGASRYMPGIYTLAGHVTGEGVLVITGYGDTVGGSSHRLARETPVKLGPNVLRSSWTRTAHGSSEGNSNCTSAAMEIAKSEAAGYRIECERQGGRFEGGAVSGRMSGPQTGYFSFLCSASATCTCTF